MSGSQVISGSLTVFTGSLIEFQVTDTGTKIGNAITDIHTVTGSLTVSGSQTFIGTKTITGSVFISGSKIVIGTNTVTGSMLVSGSLNVNGPITATTLVVQTINVTQSYSSGSNIFGNSLANTQTFTGSVLVTGSITSNGSITTGIIYGSNGNLDPTAGTNAGTTIALNGNSVANNYSIGLAAIRNSAYDMFFQTGATNGGGYRWYIGTSEKMTMTNTGNVGIGTSSPLTILQLNSAAGTNSTLYFGVNGTMNGYLGQAASAGSLSNNAAIGDVVLRSQTNLLFTSGGDTERMRITSGGNVEMYGNTLVKAASLTVGNNAAAGVTNITLQNNQNGYQFGINSACTLFQFLNGAPTVVATINGGSGVYTALSDVNKKKDFEKSTIGLNEVLQLKPTLYRFKDSDDNSQKELGFIAQEVKEFIPQAYTESGEGDDIFIGLQDRPIIAALVKAIQELKAQNDSLQSQINELKAQ